MTVTLQTAESIPPAPTCGFSISPQGGNITYTIGGTVFTSQAKATFTETDLSFLGWVDAPPGVYITQYHWDFGDGSEAYGINPHHTYVVAAPETRVVFCVTDNFNRQICEGQLINLRAGVFMLIGGYTIIGDTASLYPGDTVYPSDTLYPIL